VRLKEFIKLETKKVLGKRCLTIALVFLVASGYFILYGIGQYKHTLEERNNFQEFELLSYKQFVYPSMYGNYGLRLLFEPSSMMAFFDSGVPVPPNMISIIDGSERMKVCHSLKGQGGFALIASAFMTFAGFVLLFGSGLVLLFGFFGTKDHEWLKLLEDSTSREKLFFYLLISKAFILLLFCLALAGLSLILFIINGVTVNPGQTLVISLIAFAMLLCFLLVGLICGTLKNRFWGWASMVITWFVLAFFIPALIYHLTYGRATSIQSPYKMEVANLKLFAEYERSSLEKGGKFDHSKRGSELEKEMFLIFGEGGFKKAMGNETNMLNEMKDNASFFQNLAALFPSTHFLSVNNEMSSRGFASLVEFYEYTRKKKKDFIWYLAKNYLLSTKMVFPPFIKGNENIYQGQSQLPGNFNFGMAVNLVWLIVLLGFYWLRFNRMLGHVPKTNTNHELKENEIKKNLTNAQNTAFAAIPKPIDLPGEIKVKDLLGLFDLAVPEKLHEKAGKYIYSLELDDNARVLLEIIRSLENKPGILIFDNFLSDLSDDCIDDFAAILKSKPFKKTVVYFTKSILTSTKIADYVHKFTRERPSY
jgi:ABC-type transport system involved in multi-copper enzyme maturation permease subunit